MGIILTHDQRRDTVKDFLEKNQRCKATEVVKGVSEYMSSKPVYRILNEFKKEGQVIDEKLRPNSRDSILYVVTNNLLVSVPKELDEFKNCYLKFAKYVVKRIKKKERFLTKWLDKKEAEEAVLGLYKIFNMFTAAYLFRSTIIWPQKIHNKDNLNRLYIIMLTKFKEIQSNLFQILMQADMLLLPDMISKACYPSQFYSQYDSIFRKLDIKKERIDQVLNKIHYGRLLGYGNPDGKPS